MQPPLPPPPETSGCAALGLRSMSCTAFSLIIAYIVLLPLLLLFVRVRAVHAKGDPLDLRSLLGKPNRTILDMNHDLCVVSRYTVCHPSASLQPSGLRVHPRHPCER